jgi:hypothetical protein
MLFISDLEKSSILAAISSCRGRVGMIAAKTGFSLSDLMAHINNDESLSSKLEDVQETTEAIYKDVVDIQYQLALASGEQWAVIHSKQNTPIASEYTQQIEQTVKNIKAIVHTVNPEGGYVETYDRLAYRILASSPFATKSHLATAFSVSSQTLTQWLNSFPSFNDSVDRGMSEGEAKARNLLLSSAFESSTKVNTALLKVLANNVYNIKDESQTVVVDNRSASHEMITDDMSAIEASQKYTQMLRETE